MALYAGIWSNSKEVYTVVLDSKGSVISKNQFPVSEKVEKAVVRCLKSISLLYSSPIKVGIVEDDDLRWRVRRGSNGISLKFFPQHCFGDVEFFPRRNPEFEEYDPYRYPIELALLVGLND